MYSDQRCPSGRDRLRKTLAAIEAYLGKAMERSEDVAWGAQEELEQAVEDGQGSGC